jgi:hypothetical protein
LNVLAHILSIRSAAPELRRALAGTGQNESANASIAQASALD